MLSKQDLLERAKQASLGGQQTSEDWGEPVELEEDGGSFYGRFRGEAMDTLNDRRVFLFWDEQGHRRYMRSRFRLVQEFDRLQPQVGDAVAIYRGRDYTTVAGNSGHAYGVDAEPSDEPLPTEPLPVAAGSRDPDIPF